ncbi:hypothetical protein Baya_14292 [Bagarius yarrelli]|uniref:Uncharacterized protein n=1 Tax=Bagarius yarrelli TaxID=175774 RepID=A0A556V9M3_BAGYA|nr:hypothetical protein Baya_14292 [Bagarius yarrelli]
MATMPVSQPKMADQPEFKPKMAAKIEPQPKMANKLESLPIMTTNTEYQSKMAAMPESRHATMPKYFFGGNCLEQKIQIGRKTPKHCDSHEEDEEEDEEDEDDDVSASLRRKTNPNQTSNLINRQPTDSD